MGGITLDDFSQSVAYQEIFGQGLLEVSTRALPPKRLAAAGWTLLSILSIFGPEGLDERKASAGDHFLRY